MSNTKKLIQAAAGSAGGAGLNIEEVFSTYLYTGNGSTQTITNDIDLSGEGGLVWLKSREDTKSHFLYDTERGASSGHLTTNANYAQYGVASGLSAFNSNGFSLAAWNDMNGSGIDFASWTFRKASKFFDVVTYTGNGSTQSISHNLGSVPGSIFVKKTSGAQDWAVYHREVGNASRLLLHQTNAATTGSHWNNTTPTDAVFSVGSDLDTNQSGETYVAYLFAHNNGDGEFGPDADQDIIKCGSFTTDSSGDASVNLGFEPQFLLTKSTTETQNWDIIDVTRGMPVNYASSRLGPNQNDAETTSSADTQGYAPTPTGFDVKRIYDPSETYIYIAIRRGPMAVPESATDVFNVDLGDNDGSSTNPEFAAPFPVDVATLIDRTGGGPTIRTRLTGTGFLRPYDTVNEVSNAYTEWDFQDGWFTTNLGSTYVSHMWRRAPGFFDVVAYTGDGTYPSSRSLKHNLGVAPELMIYKNRSAAGQEWEVHLNVTGTDYLRAYLSTNLAAAGSGSSLPYGDYGATPDADNVYIRGGGFTVNNSGDDYIAYLFASLDGVSKVGSYTGTEQVQNIDCGFTSGARFVMIKKTNSTGDWVVFDTARGIVSGNDPRLSLNNTNAEVTSFDYIDPYSGGFALNTNSTMNGLGDTYIFYAIA